MPSDTTWLKEAKWGVFTHYLVSPASSIGETKITIDRWNRQIDAFDVDGLAAQLERGGLLFHHSDPEQRVLPVAERGDQRRGYANGYKPKAVDTRIGRLNVDIPQVRGDASFYPSALERECRSERALKLAIAEMYVKGISTRRGSIASECGRRICWIAGKRYLNMSVEIENESESADSKEKGIYRKMLPNQNLRDANPTLPERTLQLTN